MLRLKLLPLFPSPPSFAGDDGGDGSTRRRRGRRGGGMLAGAQRQRGQLQPPRGLLLDSSAPRGAGLRPQQPRLVTIVSETHIRTRRGPQACHDVSCRAAPTVTYLVCTPSTRGVQFGLQRRPRIFAGSQDVEESHHAGVACGG